MMVPAADALRAAGAQFLRAVGDATPAYTGALAATVLGQDARARKVAPADGAAPVALEDASSADAEGLSDELASLVSKARMRVSEALAGNLKVEMADAPACLDDAPEAHGEPAAFEQADPACSDR